MISVWTAVAQVSSRFMFFVKRGFMIADGMLEENAKHILVESMLQMARVSC